MKKLLSVAALLLLVLSFSACKDDPENLDQNLTFKFTPKMGSQPFALEQIYTNSFGQRYRVDKIAFYVDNIKLVNANGTEETIKNIDFIDFANLKETKLKLPAGNYTAIKFGLGLDVANNNIDPTVGTGVLGFEYDEYWWSWASKHIFTKIEGDVETVLNSNNFNEGFVYHLGLDELYQTVTIERNIALTDTELSTIEVAINVQKLFDGNTNQLNLLTENNTQTFDNMPLALKVRDNLAACLE